jgi:hypothetical protein
VGLRSARQPSFALAGANSTFIADDIAATKGTAASRVGVKMPTP